MHRNCWSFTNHHQEHDPNILTLQRWSPRPRTARHQDGPSSVKPSHIFCQNLSKLTVHVDRRLGVGTTNIHPPRCKKNRADDWSRSGVYFAHVWTSQTWSSPKPEITTVTKSPPYLNSTKHHLISPTTNPKTTQLFLRCRAPKSTRPMVGPTPCIKSTSSTTGEKNKLAPSRGESQFCPLAPPSASPHPARPGEMWAPQERVPWEVRRSGSRIPSFLRVQCGGKSWGPWIKSHLNYWVNLGLDCSLMGVPFCGRLTWEILIYIRGDRTWIDELYTLWSMKIRKEANNGVQGAKGDVVFCMSTGPPLEQKFHHFTPKASSSRGPAYHTSHPTYHLRG